MRFKFHFYGRRLGAQGIFERFVAEREGRSQDQARQELYNEFEHITVLATEVVPVKGYDVASEADEVAR